MVTQQNIEQVLATIKAIYIQIENGYQISEQDYKDFTEVINDINALWYKVAKEQKGTK